MPSEIEIVIDLLKEVRKDVKRINGSTRDVLEWRDNHQTLHERQDRLILTIIKVALPYLVGSAVILIALVMTHAQEIRAMIP